MKKHALSAVRGEAGTKFILHLPPLRHGRLATLGFPLSFFPFVLESRAKCA
jgi:hypothetical protein